jgi:hypothetical protein
MPALTLELKPRGRKAVPHKAQNRCNSPLAQELATAVMADRRERGIRLREEFTRATGGHGLGGSGDGPDPSG